MKTRENVLLSAFSWFKSGGTARKILFPETVDEFLSVLHSLLRERVPFKVIGESLNVLVNNGHHTDELVAYIESMRELIGNEVPIENEIVRPF